MDHTTTDPPLVTAAARFAAYVREWVKSKERTRLPTELTEMLSLLGEQTEWRVFVDGTKNLGHQASTVMLLRRLIDLTTFQGRVVIVYADYDRAILGYTAYKLSLMFTGIDPRQLDNQVASYASCSEIRFLPFHRADELREPVIFGFTGGADDLAFNGAAALNVRFFLRLQPYLWDDPPSSPRDAYHECSRIEQPNGQHFYPIEAWPELQAMAIQPPLSPSEEAKNASWHWYKTKQEFDTGLACRMYNAWAVLDTSHQGGCLLWPVYGLQHFENDAAHIALSCALVGLSLARKLSSTILLCSFSPMQVSSDWADLVDALSQDLASGEYEMPRLTAALAQRNAVDINTGRLQALDLIRWARALGDWLSANCTGSALVLHRSSHAGRWNRIDADLSTVLTLHGDVAVHLIELGPIALDVFQQFVMEADLPCVIEGQATANFLTTLGQPFLQLLRREHVIKNGYATLGDIILNAVAEHMAVLARSLRDLSPMSMSDKSALGDPSEYCQKLDRVVQALDDATNKESMVHRYFLELAEHFSRPVNDKLTMMLLALREVMLAQ